MRPVVVDQNKPVPADTQTHPVRGARVGNPQEQEQASAKTERRASPEVKQAQALQTAQAADRQ